MKFGCSIWYRFPAVEHIHTWTHRPSLLLSVPILNVRLIVLTSETNFTQFYVECREIDSLVQIRWLQLYSDKTLYLIKYCYDLRGSCSWESMKSPFDDGKFIYRRNFSVKQAASAEVIYNYAIQIQRSTANSKENPTQRYYLS